MSDDIDARIAAELDRRAAGSSKPATTPAAQPAPSGGGDDFNTTMRQFMQLQMAQAAAAMAEKSGYRSPGAPSSAPTYSESDPASLIHADRSTIETLRRTGKFKGAIEAFYRNLPGGRGSVFPGRDPK